MRPRPMTLAGLALGLLAPALAGLTASPAAATGSDSIVYLKDGRVWIAQADGSGARAFTLAPYEWSSPSEDDQGNVVVVGGLAHTNPGGTDAGPSSEIYRFAPDGNQIGGPIPTWGSYSTPSCPTYGPTSARVSPDGTKVAYGIFDCGSYSYTALWTPSTSTTLNFPNQDLGQEDYYEPQWIDSSQFLVSHVGTTVTETQARWFVHPTSGGDYAGNGWYDSAVTGTGAQGVVNRQGTLLAIFSDDAADYMDGTPRHLQLVLESSPDLATAKSGGWNLDCTVNLSAADTSDPFNLSPSFSSDGTKLYWGDDKGIEVANVADRSGGCAHVTPSLLIPGGSQPFVSPGGVHTPAPNPHQPGVEPATPEASFVVTTARPHAHHAVHFDASTSGETGGQIVKYAWSFGDGTSAQGELVKHTYRKPGTYRVRLVVTDAAGVKDKVTHSVTVRRR